MDISLNAEMEKLVNEKVRTGAYRDPATVVEQALLLLKQRDDAEARLETLLREGIESGESVEMTEKDWEDIRREVRQRHAQAEAE